MNIEDLTPREGCVYILFESPKQAYEVAVRIYGP